MRVRRAVANFNRRVANPTARSITPWLLGQGTLEHLGRRSGKRYRTPLLVFPSATASSFPSGTNSDWLKNVLPAERRCCTSAARVSRSPIPASPSKAEAATLVTGPSGVFYRLFPYNEAALMLTKVNSAQ